MIKKLGVILMVFFALSASQAQVINGTVKDEQGMPIPGASIMIKNTYTGVVSDQNGKWKLKSRPGNYTLVISMMGYKTLEKEVVVQAGNSDIEATLQQSVMQMNEALIVANTRDLAKDIMQNVRQNRKLYLNSLDEYTCQVYRKLSMMRDDPKSLHDSLTKGKTDSLMTAAGAQLLTPKQKRELRKQERIEKRELRKKRKEHRDTVNIAPDTVRVRYIGSLNETVLQQIVAKKNARDKVLAENLYDPAPPDNYIYVSIGYDEEGLEVDQIQFVFSNPDMIFTQAEDWEFNFYKPLLEKEMLGMQPFTSPLSPLGPTLYRYDYLGLFYVDSTKIFKIKVTPLFPNDALFSGEIMIMDSSFSIYEIDLTANPEALTFVKSFHIHQRYALIDSVHSVPMVTSLEYGFTEGQSNILVSGMSYYSGYNFHADTSAFGKQALEMKQYEADALQRDSVWWSGSRPVELTEHEKKYSHYIDSLRTLFSSDEFTHRVDSAYNHINVWSFLLKGIAHRDRKHGIEYYIAPLPGQMNFFGIGGYRHTLSGNIKKEFKNDFLLETEGTINYGFNNKDLRGRAGFGLTYVPKKFVRTFVRFGDYYDMINNNPSITSSFSRSNYARTKMFSVSQRMEIVNGLFGEITFEHSDQQPINTMQMDSWSNQIFGDINEPIDFERYIKSEIKLNLVYRIRQRYMYKGNRKILLGSQWPDLTFTWRMGIPGLLNSEVDYHYLEFGAGDYVRLKRWGISNWAFLVGSYVDATNLRILEHKFFRGSDNYFFSNPLESFQLLGPTLSTSSAFVRGNYIHHFEGAFLNKIPLLSLMKLSFALGTGFLLMDENNFRHIEFFGGIEKPVRIRRELFRLGVYAVTSDNNFARADFTLKFGISFYDSFRRKWEY